MKKEVPALKARIAELEECLLVANSSETCSQCKHSWSPSLIESGWCIFCIHEDTKKKLQEAEQQVAILNNSVGVVERANKVLAAELERAKEDCNRVGLIERRKYLNPVLPIFVPHETAPVEFPKPTFGWPISPGPTC